MNKFADSEEILSLLKGQKEGALATLEDGRPFVSLTGYLYEQDDADQYGNIYILMSDLARHTKHVQTNPEVGLLVTEDTRESNLYQKKRLSIKGRMSPLEDKGEFERLKERYLAEFEGAKVFFTLSDFKFYVLKPDEIYWVGGYGKIRGLK